VTDCCWVGLTANCSILHAERKQTSTHCLVDVCTLGICVIITAVINLFTSNTINSVTNSCTIIKTEVNTNYFKEDLQFCHYISFKHASLTHITATQNTKPDTAKSLLISSCFYCSRSDKNTHFSLQSSVSATSCNVTSTIAKLNSYNYYHYHYHHHHHYYYYYYYYYNCFTALCPRLPK